MKKINYFFFEPSPATPFVCLRILIGLFGLLQFFFLLPSWLDIYGSNGFVEWFISDEIFRIKSLPSVIDVANLLVPQKNADNLAVYIVTGIYLLSLTGLIVGWHTRLMSFIAWISHFTLCNTALMLGYGVETFTHIGLFYLMFSPAGSFFSMDAKRKKLNSDGTYWNATFLLRVLQLHLCFVYVQSGISKMQGTDWIRGEAIWYVLGNTNYSQHDMTWLADIPIISKALSWWTLIIETTYPVFIYWGRTRKFFLLNIIALHAGISIFMGLYLFGLIMILLNIVAFANLEAVHEILAGKRKFRFRNEPVLVNLSKKK